MTELLTSELGLWVAAAALALGLAAVAYAVLAPTTGPSRDRRRFGVEDHPDTLAQISQVTTERVSGLLGRGTRTQRWAYALDRAGIRMPLAEFVIVAGAAVLASMAVGALLADLFVAALMGVLAVGGVLLFVTIRAERRAAAFADALEDLVQLMATNLRAGHSVLQALDGVAKEMDDPTKTEVARVVNEVRLGRDLSQALEETANRMASEDFRWVAQAIAIHRQVGGNLADVLDTVGHTIRERNQIRRQVRALSAEGRLSAWVLFLLPFFVALAMSLLNPDYLAVLTTRPIGWLLIAGALFLMGIGGLWLRKVVEVKF
jgi:tight adherence protein B